MSRTLSDEGGVPLGRPIGGFLPSFFSPAAGGTRIRTRHGLRAGTFHAWRLPTGEPGQTGGGRTADTVALMRFDWTAMPVEERTVSVLDALEDVSAVLDSEELERARAELKAPL